jgi:hypothetical protein
VLFVPIPYRGIRDGGVDRAQDRHHLLLVDQIAHDPRALVRRRFIVALDQLDLLAEHAARCVDLLRGEARTVAHGGAHLRGAAGHGPEDPDPHLRLHGASRNER